MIEIKWNDLIMVAGAAIGASALLVTFFSLGVRLLTTAQQALASGNKGKKAKSDSVAKEIAFRLLAVICFIAAAAVLVYGLYLILVLQIPKPPTK
ncbi:MAG: hypothetical protein RLZZ56_93 [Actinomycetota bacterium]|jgi:hypothetical protein